MGSAVMIIQCSPADYLILAFKIFNLFDLLGLGTKEEGRERERERELYTSMAITHSKNVDKLNLIIFFTSYSFLFPRLLGFGNIDKKQVTHNPKSHT